MQIHEKQFFLSKVVCLARVHISQTFPFTQTSQSRQINRESSGHHLPHQSRRKPFWQGLLLASPIWVLMHPLKKIKLPCQIIFIPVFFVQRQDYCFQQISDKPESRFSLLCLLDKWYWPLISLSLSFSICKMGTECFSYRLAEEK